MLFCARRDRSSGRPAMRALSMVAACMAVAAGWRPGARRVHRTRLRAAPADELFRLASDDARGTLDCARLSPNALAYVGDAVLELFWRGRSIWPPAKLADQQRRVVAAVRAEAQAAAVARLRRGPVGGFALSEADDAWLPRGRNAVGRRGPTRRASSASPARSTSPTATAAARSSRRSRPSTAAATTTKRHPRNICPRALLVW